MNKETELLTRLVEIRSETYKEAEACAFFAQVLP